MAVWSWRVTVAAALVFTILCHLVFVTWAGVKLPEAGFIDIWGRAAGLIT